MDNLEKTSRKILSSLSLKITFIFFLVLLLMIPAGLIKNLIREREILRTETEIEIQDNWGRSQTLSGPIITIPYYMYETRDEKQVRVKVYLHLLPEELDINGEIFPEIRYRGIYKVAVYTSKLRIQGNFMPVTKLIESIPNENILWNEARIELEIPDLRGIQEAIYLQFDETELKTEPGISAGSPFQSGIHASLSSEQIQSGKPTTFIVEMNLRGSNSLNFIPMGQTSKVQIKSNWADPSFGGAFLPSKREINSSGFTAQWKVLHFNRNYPQIWINKHYQTTDSAFGVSLLLPVDEYQKTMRSVKYALLFLTLTFTLFFFIEILNKKKVHPVQYMMVGASLIIFYVLLLSLSEQVGFVAAYLIAATAIILQVSGFLYKIMHSTKTSLITAGTLTILYAYLFVLLQLKDYALLMGSIGLFLILSLIMYLSRNIQWSNNSHTMDKQ